MKVQCGSITSTDYISVQTIKCHLCGKEKSDCSGSILASRIFENKGWRKINWYGKWVPVCSACIVNRCLELV